MDNTRNYEQLPGGTQELQQWFDKDTSYQAPPPDRTYSQSDSQYDDKHNETTRTRHISALRTGKAAVGLSMVVCLGATVFVGFQYKEAIDGATKPPISMKGSTIGAGKARIQSVNMNIEPITLSTAKTDAEIRVGYSYQILNMKLDGPQIQRESQVETHIRLDPKVVEINYNPATKTLVYSVPDFSLTSEVVVPADMTDTTAESGSLATFGPDIATAAAKAIAGMTNTDAADAPLLLGYVAKGTMNSKNALEKFAAEVLATETDQSCTHLIPKIPDFNTMLKAEIKQPVQGQLLNPDAAHKGGTNGLTQFWDLKKADRQKVIDDATVVLPINYTITPDASKIAALKAYEKSGVFTDKTLKVVCGVAKDFKFTNISDPATSTK